VPSSADAGELFRQEYERINRTAYSGILPPFPGVELVERTDIFAMTRARGDGPWRHLRPFLLSTHVTGKLLIESIRHEIAHAAAILLDDDQGHGPAWERHARLAGASSLATLDPGHPLRADWPAP